MNRLMRMTYGRSGCRLERVLVSGRHSESAVDPLWLKALLLMVWLTIPILISRFGIPTTSLQQTIIDTSRLVAKPVTEPIPQAPPTVPAPVEKTLPKAPELQPLPAAKSPESPPVEEIKRPIISRPAISRGLEPVQARPGIVRERTQPGPETGPIPTARIRRDSAPAESVGDRAAISRSREGTTSAVETAAPRVAAQRERSQPTGSSSGETPAPGGLRRGVSLTSLQICSGTRQEEDAVKTVLALVGSRQSCSDGNGEYHFTGTQRISSFNLIIYPARGRTPSNRCEELENAYRCLKSR